MNSSSALPICRVDWRPSPGLAVAIAMLGLLAALSLVLSALPKPASSVLAVSAVAYAAFLVRRELGRERITFVWAGGDSAATLNFGSRTQSLTEPSLHFRGPLAGFRGIDETGRRWNRLWWPDTLSSTDRRQLRLVDQIKKETPVSVPAQQTA